MKNSIKVITMFILGIITAIGITTIAYSVAGKNVLVKSNGWNVKNVDEAVSYLKDREKCDGMYPKVIGTLKIAAHDKTPDMYEIDPGDGIKRNFYVLEDEGKTVDLIMDRNMVDYETISWNTANTYMQDNGYKTSWKDVLDIKLPSVQQIATATNITNPNSNAYVGGVTWQGDVTSEYCWIIEYSYRSLNGKCSNSLTTEYKANRGYWTSTLSGSYGYGMSSDGRILIYETSSYGAYGVRPVITVKKSSLQK